MRLGHRIILIADSLCALFQDRHDVLAACAKDLRKLTRAPYVQPVLVHAVSDGKKYFLRALGLVRINAEVLEQGQRCRTSALRGCDLAVESTEHNRKLVDLDAQVIGLF